VIGRIGFVLFNLAFLVFTFTLVATLVRTFYPTATKTLRALKISAIVLGLGSMACVITLSVLKEVPIELFVFDASWLVLSVTSVGYALALVATWIWTIYLVRTKLDRGERQDQAMKNAIIMLVIASFVCLMFIARLATVCVGAFVNYDGLSLPLKAVGMSCDLVVALSIGFWFFFQFRKLSWEKSNPDGYNALSELDGAEETSIPLRYKDF
jgi:hypothetical protein